MKYVSTVEKTYLINQDKQMDEKHPHKGWYFTGPDGQPWGPYSKNSIVQDKAREVWDNYTETGVVQTDLEREA